MANVKIEDIRNIALCGHGSSGKTTLVDKLLVKTGAVNANPSVDDGTSICDFDPEEKHHKYTIEAKRRPLRARRQAVQRASTRPAIPTSSARRSAPCAASTRRLIVINAQSGIEVNTRRVFDGGRQGGRWAG